MDIKKLLGNRIKLLRIKRNLTQEQFSELIGISQRTLSAIECGRSFVTSKTLDNMAKILEISVEELFKTDYIKPTSELLEEISLKLNKMDRKELEITYKFIKSLD